MVVNAVKQVMRQVQQWPIKQQIELAQEIDRLTSRERWRHVEDGVSQRAGEQRMGDDEIDAIVGQVRRDKPLHRR